MTESFFDEMKRYVRFGSDDENALRAFAPHARAHFQGIAEDFYARLEEHESARKVFSGPEQVKRLQKTMCEWMDLLFVGPWDEAYFDRRLRIGRMHVRIALPQRYMFGAMDLIRVALMRAVQEHHSDDAAARQSTVWALSKMIDIELAIMLESYREAFVDEVQRHEREEKRLLRQQLALSEAKYEEVVEKAEALITTFTPQGAIVLFNHRCEELCAMTREQAAGRSWFELFVGEADRERVVGLCQEALSGRRALPYEGPAAYPAANGRRVRWHFTTLPNSAGPNEPHGTILCAFGLDVTEEHELSSRTRRAERLASLGTMAAGLAHEIRNPLNAAHLQLTLLQRRLSRPAGADVEGARSAAALVSSEMQRLAMLVQEFLQFARPQPLRLAANDLRSTAEEIVALIGPEAQAAGVDLALPAGPRAVAQFDDERMKQVLLNLVRNAVEATGRGGTVQISVSPAGGSAYITVEDDGPGFPADAPIFEPFFTTKTAGTGLGLSIVHRIVNDHGGKITVSSRPGHTIFTVLLPLSSDPPTPHDFPPKK